MIRQFLIFFAKRIGIQRLSFIRRHGAANLSKTLYGGIDFGLNERGEVLLFEANATMAVIVPDKDQRWDYRRPATEKIYRAVWTMLRSRSTKGRPIERE